MKIKTKDALEEQINCDVLESIWHSCHFGSRCVFPVRFQTCNVGVATVHHLSFRCDRWVATFQLLFANLCGQSPSETH